MNNNEYQYNSCSSKGICSTNPRSSSLLEVLVLYLKFAGYYIYKLYQNNIENQEVKTFLLNTISMIVTNPDFSEKNFNAITKDFNLLLPILIKEYEKMCKENNIKPEHLKSIIDFDNERDIIKSIQLGEKEFLKKTKNLSLEKRNLYTILFVLAKSICTNILDLQTFEIEEKEGFETILKILNFLNFENEEVANLNEIISETAKIDNKLMQNLKNVQEKRYGKQQRSTVSYSTIKGKAILVVGSNIKELEDILESTKSSKVDIYTHDAMMLANTFPYFSKYKNLKGQFGQGLENCLLDFATFPGPIILTRHSLFNIENLYRGRLYTTDRAYQKGVIQIKNKNFSDVIKTAQEMKGFKTGKQCESIEIGFNKNNLKKELKEKIEKASYKKIFIIGLSAFSQEQRNYFNKLLQYTPNDILIISLSHCLSKENIICLDTCFDTFAINYVVEIVEKICNKKMVIFFPECNRHSISQMIYFAQNPNNKIYMGKCTPILLNPNLFKTLSENFNIKSITSIKKDLEEILNNK